MNKNKRSGIVARAAMLITLAYAVALLCAATPISSLKFTSDANANGNSLTNAATISATNGYFNNLAVTNGVTGPVATTNLVGTVTNVVSAPSVTSALFTGNASALTNFPSAATMGLGALATSNSITTSNITGLGSGVAAALGNVVSGTGEIVVTSNAIMASPTFVTPQATTYPTTYLVAIRDIQDTTGPKTFTSVDAQTFSPFYKGTAGTDIYSTTNFADPRIIKVGASYYMFFSATTGGAVNSIGLATSTDLNNWTTISTPNWSSLFTGSQNAVVNGCIYFDGINYWLYFATMYINSTSSTATPYVVQFYPTTDTFGTPAAVALASSRTYADVMAVWKNSSTYYALLQSFGSSGSGQYVEMLSSSTLNSTWAFSSSNNANGWGSNIEAGAQITLPNGNTRVFFTDYGGGNLYSSDSTSFPSTWASRITLNPFPNVVPTYPPPSQYSDWIDIVPYADLQTDQCLNALQRGCGILQYNQTLTTTIPGSSEAAAFQFFEPSLSNGNYLIGYLGQSFNLNACADWYYVPNSSSAAELAAIGIWGVVPTLGMFGTGNGFCGNYSSDPNSSAPAGSFSIQSNVYAGGAIDSSSTQTTVNGSSAGTAVCSMPFQGASYKKAMIFLNGFYGTGTYTLPIAFTSTNDLIISGTLFSDATVTATQVSISTSTNSTGSIIVEGY